MFIENSIGTFTLYMLTWTTTPSILVYFNAFHRALSLFFLIFKNSFAALTEIQNRFKTLLRVISRCGSDRVENLSQAIIWSISHKTAWKCEQNGEQNGVRCTSNRLWKSTTINSVEICYSSAASLFHAASKVLKDKFSAEFPRVCKVFKAIVVVHSVSCK